MNKRKMNQEALTRRNICPEAQAKLEEAFRAGWLHNVLSRITPLTLRRRDDYLAMADVFIETAEEANHVLDRFDADLELFCSMAEITVTEHMTPKTVSQELRAHIELYTDIAALLAAKFDAEQRNPIQTLAQSPLMWEAANPFIKDFMDKQFNRS